MLVTPYNDPSRWSKIPGVPNCLGKDIAPKVIYYLDLELGIACWTPKERVVPYGTTVSPDSEGTYYLAPNNAYRAILPKVEIPKDCYASLSPRSTFMRMGVICPASADIDPGYRGHLVIVFYTVQFIQVKQGIPLFTIKLFREEGLRPYNGYWQETDTI